MINTYKKTDKTKLAENFTSDEFACNGSGCCSTVKIDEKLVENLQKIRDHFGKPITITSGYRCTKHNKKIGGASGSRHTKGQAADILVRDTTPAEVAKYAESIGIKGIGLYGFNDGNFVHIDTREKKSFWYGHAQAYRSTFGGGNPVQAWQQAAIADGFKFPKYGADGAWGAECVSVAAKAVVKKRAVYTYKNLTKIVQEAVGVTADGKFGNDTKKAVIEYQKEHGLVADGEVGINTWKKILNIV